MASRDGDEAYVHTRTPARRRDDGAASAPGAAEASLMPRSERRLDRERSSHLGVASGPVYLELSIASCRSDDRRASAGRAESARTQQRRSAGTWWRNVASRSTRDTRSGHFKACSSLLCWLASLVGSTAQKRLVRMSKRRGGGGRVASLIESLERSCLALRKVI